MDVLTVSRPAAVLRRRTRAVVDWLNAMMVIIVLMGDVGKVGMERLLRRMGEVGMVTRRRWYCWIILTTPIVGFAARHSLSETLFAGSECWS